MTGKNDNGQCFDRVMPGESRANSGEMSIANVYFTAYKGTLSPEAAFFFTNYHIHISGQYGLLQPFHKPV